MTDKHKEAFREEAYELLGELEAALLELEKTPDDNDLIGRVFRAMHTIKGSGAMFGFDNIASFTHDIENVYDHVRNGKIQVTKPLIDLTLSACDCIREMIGSSSSCSDEEKVRNIVSSFKKYLADVGAPADKKKEERLLSSTNISQDYSADNVTYRIRFRPAQNIFSFGTNPLLLLNELRSLGNCSVVAQTDAIPVLTDIDPEACYTYWDIILTTKRDINAIRDVFIFVEDECEIRIDTIDVDPAEEDKYSYKKLGEILIERGDITTVDLEKALSYQKRIGEVLVDAGMIDPSKIQSALAEQEHVRELQQRKDGEKAASIRVPADKLDALVNMVGELVTVQSRLSQIATLMDSMEVIQIAEEVERLTAELRDNTMSIRMLPIGTTFSKFNRLVRDLSRDLGKEITLKTEGAETELDKTVIEKLNDPLVHLIRNSIDHGIEPPEKRESLGKPRHGTVRLSASHSGANVLIQIRDDGAGLDKEAIRTKAVERGLIAPDAILQEKDIFALTFAPGFSLARQVTNVSGRGVGMDVVRRGIESMQGTIGIESEKGIGTKITLKLPLTLAIIDGLLVGVGDDYFVLPLSAIEECVELTRDDVAKAHGRHIADIRGEIVPYILLREQFRIAGTPPAIEQIVTTRFNSHRVGLVVDQVIGEHQTVIKSLGKVYRNVEEVSGATILGDGKVALILDLPKLIQKAERESIHA